jgi:hypothetical protein
MENRFHPNIRKRLWMRATETHTTTFGPILEGTSSILTQARKQCLHIPTETVQQERRRHYTVRNVGKYKKRHSGNIPADLNLGTTQFNPLPSSVGMRPKYHRKTSFRIATAFIRVCHRNCPQRSLGTPDYRIEINEKHILHLKGLEGRAYSVLRRPCLFSWVDTAGRRSQFEWMLQCEI